MFKTNRVLLETFVNLSDKSVSFGFGTAYVLPVKGFATKDMLLKMLGACYAEMYRRQRAGPDEAEEEDELSPSARSGKAHEQILDGIAYKYG